MPSNNFILCHPLLLLPSIFPSIRVFSKESALQDFLELTPKKDVLFIIRDWNAKVGSQETPGVTGKFGLGVQNEADKSLTEFWQENALVIANTLSTTQEKTLHMDITRWSTQKSG